MLNMFRMLIHPSSGDCNLFVELFHGLYCSGSMCVGVTLWFGCGGVVSVCRLKPAGGLQDVNSALETMKNISYDCKPQEYAFDFFGKSLAVHLKNMPLQRALICQQKLQQVMMDERMYRLDEGTRHTSSPLATFSCYSSISSPYSAHSLHQEGV